MKSQNQSINKFDLKMQNQEEHTDYDVLPKFRPIMDTVGSSHYHVGKYLIGLPNPLTSNEFTSKDSFDAAERIKRTPKELFDDGYAFVSFDVTSLFTNVPLERTINIVLDRIYNQHVVTSNSSKRSLRKLIKETCTKKAFSSDKKVYEKLDGVSMGSSLGPVLTNIIMTEIPPLNLSP